jgi:hypothetical protein
MVVLISLGTALPERLKMQNPATSDRVLHFVGQAGSLSYSAENFKG